MAKARCGVSVRTAADASGTIPAFLGWIRHAAARVRANSSANLRPEQNVRCVCPASFSGRRSSIVFGASEIRSNCALVALAMTCRGNGPARSKKPGCCICSPVRESRHVRPAGRATKKHHNPETWDPPAVLPVVKLTSRPVKGRL